MLYRSCSPARAALLLLLTLSFGHGSLTTAATERTGMIGWFKKQVAHKTAGSGEVLLHTRTRSSSRHHNSLHEEDGLAGGTEDRAKADEIQRVAFTLVRVTSSIFTTCTVLC